MKPRVVIDTNVIVSAFKSQRGTSSRLLQSLTLDKFTSCVSVPLVVEYEAVLKRLFPEDSKEKIDIFLDHICAVSVQQHIHYLWRPHLKDPNDEMVLELAIASSAQFIVTYNSKDFKTAQLFGIQLTTPREILITAGVLSPKPMLVSESSAQYIICGQPKRKNPMSTISLRLPNSLHKVSKYLAEKENISLNQLITAALSEKVSALGTEEFLLKRAARGNQEKYLEVLRSAPDVEPEWHDRF